MKSERYKSRQTHHKQSVLTAPANRAHTISMSRIKEMVLGTFWGPGGPKLVFEGNFSYCNLCKLDGRFYVKSCDNLMMVW